MRNRGLQVLPEGDFAACRSSSRQIPSRRRERAETLSHFHRAPRRVRCGQGVFCVGRILSRAKPFPGRFRTRKSAGFQRKPMGPEAQNPLDSAFCQRQNCRGSNWKFKARRPAGAMLSRPSACQKSLLDKLRLCRVAKFVPRAGVARPAGLGKRAAGCTNCSRLPLYQDSFCACGFCLRLAAVLAALLA